MQSFLFLQVLGWGHLELHDTSSRTVPVSCRQGNVHHLGLGFRHELTCRPCPSPSLPPLLALPLAHSCLSRCLSPASSPAVSLLVIFALTLSRSLPATRSRSRSRCHSHSRSLSLSLSLSLSRSLSMPLHHTLSLMLCLSIQHTDLLCVYICIYRLYIIHTHSQEDRWILPISLSLSLSFPCSRLHLRGCITTTICNHLLHS